PPPRRRRPAIERRTRRLLLDTVERFEPDAILVWNLAGLPLTILNALAAVDAPAVFVVADTWPAQAWTTDPWHRMVEGAPMLARLVSRMFGISAGLPALGRLGDFC